MIKITIDTNTINAKEKCDTLNKLDEFHSKGLIKKIATNALIDETRKNILREKKADSYENIGEPHTVGIVGIGQTYIGGNSEITFQQIADIIFPQIATNELNDNQINDIRFLVSHANSDSEYFVTKNTKDFIHAKKTNSNRKDKSYENYKKRQLENLGIQVITPDGLIKIIEDNKSLK